MTPLCDLLVNMMRLLSIARPEDLLSSDQAIAARTLARCTLLSRARMWTKLYSHVLYVLKLAPRAVGQRNVTPGCCYTDTRLMHMIWPSCPRGCSCWLSWV
jgi:hypothetical protein